MNNFIKVGVVAGEESGDKLAAALLEKFQEKYKKEIKLYGIGGEGLSSLGLKSYFPMQELSLMGIGEVIWKLPSLYRNMKNLLRYLVAQDIDVLLLVDSPDFTHRLAKRIKKVLPNLKIVKYIAPTVWAWRPGRAAAMRNYIDNLLVVFPFEVEILKNLGGPKAIYVGHKLSYDSHILEVQKQRKAGDVLLLLPGSRRYEISRLLKEMQIVVERVALRPVLVTLPRLKAEIEKQVKTWKVKPLIVSDEKEKWDYYKQAKFALASSGTVLLELALCKIPMISIYKLDWLSNLFIKPRIKIWSAALPNIIVNEPIVPEYYNEAASGDRLSYYVNYNIKNTALLELQEKSFAGLIEKLRQKEKMPEEAFAEILGISK